MYSEIARNKRRSVVFTVVFFLIWMGVGAVSGLLFAAVYHPVNPSWCAVGFVPSSMTSPSQPVPLQVTV